MVWKDCGYFTLTKNRQKVSVVIKHVRYFLEIEKVKQVLEGKLPFTLVYERPTEGVHEPIA
jgi:hypothetical protein